ncbi:mucin-binding protein [Secundilactobacillus muriivasis]
MTNEKVHYKMYKDGRTWVFAAITVATLGLGIVTGTGVTAHADNTDTGVTATGATDTTSGTTATLGGSSSSADNSGTVDNTATQPVTPAEVPVDSTTSTDPTAATTTATPTSAPQAADTQTTPKYVGNAQSQPAIIDRNSGEATKSTDGTVATEAGSNGVTVGAYWTAENGDGDVTQSISSDGNDKSYSTVSASAQNIQSHFTFGNTSTTDITTGAVYLITPYADYTSDIADGKIDPHFETNMTAAEVVASLPTGFTATFSQKGGQYNIAADQLTDDQVATLVAVELKGTIAAGQTYDVTWNQNLIAAGTDGRYADTHTLYLSPNGLIQPDASAYADVATQTMPAADGTVTIGTTFGNSKVSSDATQTSDGVNDIPVNGFAYFDVTVEDPNTITAGFSLANNTDDYNATNVFFMLPKLYSPNYNNATNLFTVDATQVNESTFTDAFPSDVSIMYSVESGKYLSMSDMLAQHPDFTWDQLLAFQVRGTLAAQTSYQINLPLDYVNQDKTDLISTDVNAATGAFAFNGVGDYTGDIQSNLSLTMPYGLQLDGPYSPIYVNADGSYTLVGSDLFNLMPQIDKADVLVSNNGNYFDGTAADTTLYYGGFFYLKLAKLQAILAQNGYTVELNADGTPMDGYMFDTLNGPAVVHDSTDGTIKVIAGGTNSGGIFAVIKVLNTHDSTVQATKDTTIKLTDNLDGVGPSNYYTVGASDVTATLSDPDGVLKDNGDGTYSVTKPGQYTVTYSLAISDAVTVTKQATVTVDPKITYGTYTTTRTINFVNDDGTTNTNTPVTQMATYKTTTNQLTGETVYTVQNAYYEAQVPVEAGYKADTDTIAQQALGATNVMPADSTITVNYQPTYTYGSATSTRTINFVNSDGTTASAAPIVQTITYKTATKDATGETVYTPAGAYYEVSVPTQTNYTPQQATVAQQAVGASTTAPTNTTVTVTYDPTSTYGTATSTRTINFVNADGTTNSQAPVVQTITYKTVTNAVTGETVYTPQGAYYQYQVASQTGYAADKQVIAQEAVGATNVAPTNSNVTVTYTPTYTYGTATSTRTINFVNSDGTTSVDPIVQTITYKTATKEATGETVYTPTGAYYEVTVPTQANYTPQTTTISQQAVGASIAAPANTTLTVTYDPTSTYGTATSTRTINFANADGTTNSQAPVVQTIIYKTVTNAVTGETIYTPQGAYYEYHVSPQDGYVADQKVIAQEAVGATNMAPTNSTVTVTYTPTYTYGTTTSTRTINFVNTDGTDNGISPVVQTITYKTVTSDATGETVYTPQDAYYEVQVPTQTGYTANQTTVAQAAVGALATTPENTTVTVTYTKNATTDPGDGGSTTDPDNGGTTTPDNGGSTTDPDNGGTTTPSNGDSATGSDNGETTTAPADNDTTSTNGGSTTTAPSENSTATTPENGDATTVPETDSTTTDEPDNGTVTTNDNSQPTRVDGQFAKGVATTSSEPTITTQTGAAKQASSTAHLPQTNETKTQATTMIGMSLLGLMSVFGLARKPRRKE